MKMQMTGHMRMEQRMKLAPRMIQSMEVLQLPLLALQEKIEAELNSNPVLEVAQEGDGDIPDADNGDDLQDEAVEQRELIVRDDSDNVEDFQRLDSLGDSFGDYLENDAPIYNHRPLPADSDKKFEAIQNTAATEQSLHDFLAEQWRLVEAEELVKEAGARILDFIDEKGFLTVPLEQLVNKEKFKFEMEHLTRALNLIQNLEPAGVGARDVRECLLIQISQQPEDMLFEQHLITSHWEELLENKMPQIAKKMNCGIEDINEAVVRLSKLDTSPGLGVGRNDNHPITADIIVTLDEDKDDYIVSLADTSMPNLCVNSFYAKMSKDKNIDNKTRDFLQQNIRSAQWFMDAIEQRKSTLLKVATVIVDHQREFFDKGQMYLKPLPMQTVADQVGVHIATVSRAVSGKYVQCSQGILPLRNFFSGGMEDDSGQSRSWDAVRAELQQIIDREDKSNPYSDDELRQKLEEAGVGKIARRTVAKYRKLMNIPTARFRKKY